jgi:hypothetical protein
VWARGIVIRGTFAAVNSVSKGGDLCKIQNFDNAQIFQSLNFLWTDLSFLLGLMLYFSSLSLNFSVGLLIYCTGAVMAQEEGFRAGVKLGVNTSQIDGDGYMGFYKFSPVAGFFASHNVGKHYRFQYEIVYQNKGSRKLPDPDNGIYDSYKIHMQTIGVPVLIQRRWKKWEFELGAGFNMLLSSREENENGTLKNSGFSWSKYELDGMLGAGYIFNDHVSIQARSHRSLSSIVNTTSYTRYGVYGAAYHTVIALTLNYRF